MRKAQKAQTRQRVLAAAQRCFAEHGFARTTIARIARTAGVSVGTVHAHFDDKVSLLAASLYDEIERALDAAWRGTEAAPPLDRLEAAARSLYTWYASDVARSRVLLTQTAFIGGDWGARFDAQLSQFAAEVGAAFARGMATGALPVEAPPELLAQGFMGDYLAVLMQGLRAEAFDVPAEVARLMALTRLRCGLPFTDPARRPTA